MQKLIKYRYGMYTLRVVFIHTEYFQHLYEIYSYVLAL